MQTLFRGAPLLFIINNPTGPQEAGLFPNPIFYGAEWLPGPVSVSCCLFLRKISFISVYKTKHCEQLTGLMFTVAYFDCLHVQ